MSNNKYRKKLIEVALPLEAINVASAREKSIRHGHPSTLHLWWARRPLAACRAVLFASLVNDPEDDPMYGISEDVAYTERAKLFELIEELVQWDNSNNPRVINAARLEIARSIAANKVADKELNDDTPLVANSPKLSDEQTKYLPESPPEYTPRDVRFKMPNLKPEQVNHFLAHYAPAVVDPFAGGGSIPFEAQRLGLRVFASDLNPVPVLINKALVEIPPKFAGQHPINPSSANGSLGCKEWRGSEGLVEDIRYYGDWMRNEAEKRIGNLYPGVKISREMVDQGRPDLQKFIGQELTVIAWLWARTVKSPNPAAKGKRVPLVSTFWLSKKKGAEFYIKPIINKTSGDYKFKVHSGVPKADDIELIDSGTKAGRGCNFRCLLTEQPITEEHIKSEAMAGKLGNVLIGIVVQFGRTRTFVSPVEEHEKLAQVTKPDDLRCIDSEIALDKRAIWCLLYGLTTFDRLFTNRQLVALTTFSDLVAEAREKAIRDMTERPRRDVSHDYADAIATYLSFAVDKMTDTNSTLCSWQNIPPRLRATFGRQALPMVWDYAEASVFSDAAGDFQRCVRSIEEVLENRPNTSVGNVSQKDAASFNFDEVNCLVSTDPPYYDNIGYADLSDYFYVWMRRSLGTVYPNVFSTVVTPKSNELIASPYRHQGSKSEARQFFEHGLSSTFKSLRNGASCSYPVTIYYAFKQAETDNESGTASTGWETMLEGVLGSGYRITATWPLRSELSTRNVGRGTNALASSIVLACIPRLDDASMVARREFADELRRELPNAIKHLQSGNVAPVDLAQASIGPGMAVFSRYSKVINADGSPMSVREALLLINQILDESLVEQESDFDSETRFALKWFEQYGLGEGPFGDAENLSKAMAVSVKGIEDAGILRSKAGKVRLLKRDELDLDWDPLSDPRLTMWEVTQHLIRTLEAGGESGTADLLLRIGSEKGDIARELAYRLYQTCERKSLAKEAGAYNALVVSWPEITRLSRNTQPKTVASLLPGMEDDQ